MQCHCCAGPKRCCHLDLQPFACSRTPFVIPLIHSHTPNIFFALCVFTFFVSRSIFGSWFIFAHTHTHTSCYQWLCALSRFPHRVSPMTIFGFVCITQIYICKNKCVNMCNQSKCIHRTQFISLFRKQEGSETLWPPDYTEKRIDARKHITYVLFASDMPLAPWAR